MDAVDILKVCFRRWYVMLPILLAAAGISYQLLESQETTYTAATSYGLVQPRLPGGTGTIEERNPLGTDDSDLVAAALEAQLNSREAQAELGSDATRGWGPGEVENGSSYSVKIPMFETMHEVRAWGTDEEEVRAVVDRVIEAAPGIVDEIQARAGAPETVRYEPFVLASTQVDVLSSTSGIKLVIAVMGLGVLVGAAWSIVADRLLRNWLPRRPMASRTVTASADGSAEADRPAEVRTPGRAGKIHRPGKANRPVTPTPGDSAPTSDRATEAARAEQARRNQPMLRG